MSDLNLELAKEEYVGLTNVERLALLKSKTETKLGWIQEGALKSLESIIAKGLWRDKMEDMKKSAKDTLSNPLSTPQDINIAKAKLVVVAGFHEAISEAKLANKAPRIQGGHSINLNDPEVYSTFLYAQNLGLITSEEVTQVENLAKYERPLFQDVLLKDVIGHFNPELLDGAWHELGESNTRQLTFKLNTATPEQTYIKIESRDIDGDWRGEWTHNTAHHGVQAARIYKVAVRNEGRQELRWRCEYVLDCVVS